VNAKTGKKHTISGKKEHRCIPSRPIRDKNIFILLLKYIFTYDILKPNGESEK